MKSNAIGATQSGMSVPSLAVPSDENDLRRCAEGENSILANTPTLKTNVIRDGSVHVLHSKVLRMHLSLGMNHTSQTRQRLLTPAMEFECAGRVSKQRMRWRNWQS